MSPCVLAKLLTVILALVLGASGPLRALAHGHETGLTAMVICGEHGAEMVYLDAAGNPVDADKACLADPCDDCLLSGPSVVAGLAALSVPPGQARELAPQPHLGLPAMRWATPARARGPPIGEDLA